MKTLLILRHAKSSWDDVGLADHDRPLNKRGKRDAPRMGRLLDELDLQPQQILSSTARRARKTAAEVAEHCGFEGTVETIRSLYHAFPDQYIDVLTGIHDDVDRVMVVGHNPGLEELLALLTGHVTHLPTAALARIDLDIDHWSQLRIDTPGTLADLWRPRELPEG